MYKIKFSRLLSAEEVKELSILGNLEDLFKSLGHPFLADFCKNVSDTANEYDKILNNTAHYTDKDQTIFLIAPTNTSAMFRVLFIEQRERQTEKVRNSTISKGTTVGRFKIEKNSCIPEPRPSLARNIKDLYEKWRNDGTIDANGFLTKDVEVNSRHQAVGLALGCSASANVYLSKDMSWD